MRGNFLTRDQFAETAGGAERRPSPSPRIACARCGEPITDAMAFHPGGGRRYVHIECGHILRGERDRLLALAPELLESLACLLEMHTGEGAAYLHLHEGGVERARSIILQARGA